MIVRRHWPDPTDPTIIIDRDDDRGPGPVGRLSMPGYGRYLRAARVAESIEPMPRPIRLSVERGRK